MAFCDRLDTGPCDPKSPPFAGSRRNRQDASSRQPLALSRTGHGRTQGQRLPVRRNKLTADSAKPHFLLRGLHMLSSPSTMRRILIGGVIVSAGFLLCAGFEGAHAGEAKVGTQTLQRV